MRSHFRQLKETRFLVRRSHFGKKKAIANHLYRGTDELSLMFGEKKVILLSSVQIFVY
ncbi:hypothetical protein ACOKW7_19340 [Limnospira platensis CENA597]|uniref:hypothetical protein n=1 Tax=Limnospira platensis TaxID=118562 RepID=UPI003DA1881A